MKCLASGFTLAFLLVWGTADANDNAPLKRIVHSVVKETTNDFYLKVFNSQSKFKNTYELIKENFNLGNTFSKKDQESLRKLRAPTIYLVKNGIAFEWEKSKGFKVFLSEETESVHDEELNDSKSWIPIFLAMPQAQAQGWEEVVVGGLIAARPLIVAYLTRFAWEVAAGASLGCAINIYRTSGEEAIGDACKKGARFGALMLVGGMGTGALWKAATNGSTIARLVVASGITAGVALVGSDLKDVATMNSSILRCSGDQGDFIVSARMKGVTGRNLYEVTQNKIIFPVHKEPGKSKSDDVAVDQDPKKLEAFFDQYNIFPGADKSVVEVAANQVSEEVIKFKSECKTHKDGYSRQLFSSEGEKINQHSAESVR